MVLSECVILLVVIAVAVGVPLGCVFDDARHRQRVEQRKSRATMVFGFALSLIVLGLCSSFSPVYASDYWPRPGRYIPIGPSEVRVWNHSNTPLRVGLRFRNFGRDFEVPAKNWASAYVLPSCYDVYLQPKNDRTALYQGDLVRVGPGDVATIHVGLDASEDDEGTPRNRHDGENYKVRRLGANP